MAEVLVTIAEYWTPFEAHLARAKLEEQDVPCVIEDEGVAALFGAAAGRVKLKVPAHLAERAEEILGDFLAPPHEAETDDEQ